MPPKAGTKYTYTGEKGLGAAHAERDLPAEMADLDLAPGTEVTYDGYDNDRDLVLLEWTDAQGTPRRTSVEPDHFSSMFKKG